MALEFQTIAWHAEDVESLEEESEDSASSTGHSSKKQSIYELLTHVIKAFGRTADGQSASLTITGFKPFFYLKLSDDWRSEHTGFLRESLERMSPCFKNVHSMSVVSRKDLDGFSDFRDFNFMRVEFNSAKYMRQAAYLLGEREVICRRISSVARLYHVYEHGIEPYIRLFHIKRLTSCGWLRVDASKHTSATCLLSSCKVDRQADYKDVCNGDPGAAKRDAPFQIMSFDLECYSESGDFPVALRDYELVADVLYCEYKKWEKDAVDNYALKNRTTRLLARLLGVDDPRYLGVSPPKPPTGGGTPPAPLQLLSADYGFGHCGFICTVLPILVCFMLWGDT